MRDQVARIRQLMLEAAPIEVFTDSERSARSRFEYYEANCDPLPRFDRSPRQRAIRQILRIVNSYGWQCELAAFLDRHDVESPDQLDQAGLAALAHRMNQLEECVQNGLGAPDAPPAT